MQKNELYLLTESAFHASYLFTLWKSHFGPLNNEERVYVRDKQPTGELLLQRKQFHSLHQGKKQLTNHELKILKDLYPDLSKTEETMITLFGIPEYPVDGDFLGLDLNTEYTKSKLQKLTEKKSLPFFFIFLDQILAPWWIELTRGDIINAHSAVLPYARGMYAIENIAITQDPFLFEKCAGATIHYIDTGVDTGPIIQAQRLQHVFAYTSLWEVKAHSFITAFNLLFNCAKRIFNDPMTTPVGTYADSAIVGPNFRSNDFTLQRIIKAEHDFLYMKSNINKRF